MEEGGEREGVKGLNMNSGGWRKGWMILGISGVLLGSAAALWSNVCGACYSYSGGAALAAPQDYVGKQAAVPTVRFSREHPASVQPVLTWSKVSGAVAYELELLEDTLQDSGVSPSPLFATKRIYVNGYQADLTAYAERGYVYWRVRGLDIEGNAIGDFSAPERIEIDRQKLVAQSPTPTSIFNQSRGASLLYPVYAWIPVHGAERYEVEILNALPENPRGIEPSRHRIDAMIAEGFDYYDDVPRISDKTLYWRVRALDHAGNPIGGYSEAAAFNIDLRHHAPVAVYGDSITHGGGSISYSPADWEYSYPHYLDFPTINLGRSGDTSETMVERFERDVLPFRPQYLLILAGTNSLRASATAKSVIEDLMVLKTKCQVYHIQPVFLTIPPIHPGHIERAFHQETAPDWREKIWLVNQYIRTQRHIEVARNLAYDGMALPEALAVDGLHPDAAGKKKMAEAINRQWKAVAW